MKNNPPIVWSIAGSDCSGLAGQVADVRAIEALGVHACSITTAVTAQNSQKVYALNPLTKVQIEAQFSALKSDLPAKAIKIGLLPSIDAIQVLSEFLDDYQGDVVLDPVLCSSSGMNFLDDTALKALQEILPKVTLLTPNIPELELLSGIEIDDEKTVYQAVDILLAKGVKNVLLKGGHFQEKHFFKTSDQVSDYFCNSSESFWLHSDKQNNENTRGTGCVLAASITAALALNYSLKDAVVIGKMQINQAIENGYQLAGQKGPLKPLSWPSQQKYMPKLTTNLEYQKKHFKDIGEEKLGLYPVVDRAEWLERLLPLGISTIQLRVKDLQGIALATEIQNAVNIAEKYQARLFINDYWQLAIKYKAYGVHLGQEDLDDANVSAIADAGLRLGLSTHCYYEVARAHAITPSYLACGPVFHTDSKQMPWIPHGTENLQYWVETMAEYPWVAIGGIHLARIEAVAKTGVSGIAMISAITQAEDPERVTQQMMKQIETSQS